MRRVAGRGEKRGRARETQRFRAFGPAVGLSADEAYVGYAGVK